jgi:carbamoyltransferase
MVVLGTSLVGHDRAWCAMGLDRTLIGAVEEERISRRKGGLWVSAPEQVDRALELLGVSPASVTRLALAGLPERFARRPHPPGDGALWMARLDSVLASRLVERLPNLDSVQRYRHHLCHAASAWIPSGFEQATVITVDSKGEDESAALFRGAPGGLERLGSVPLPHSLGYLYTVIAEWAGMRGHECEGKLMGLAAHGCPELVDTLRSAFLADSSPSWGFRLSPRFTAVRDTRQAWRQVVEEVLGPSLQPGIVPSRHAANVAASFQALVEEVLLSLVLDAVRGQRQEPVCLAGGVFMNSVANGRIARELSHLPVFVPPWPGDAGLAIGSTLLAVDARPGDTAWTPYLGPAVERQSAQAALTSTGLRVRPLDLNRVAALLAEGAVIGWARGRLEFGPRALGNRSILAHPGFAGARDRLNCAIKNREDWRPFAPVVLDAHASRLFNIAGDCRWMGFVAIGTHVASETIGQALHVDGTGRVQILSRTDNPVLYELIERFHERTGVPALINTSFNIRGEPIVASAEEAVATFRETGMDGLVLDDLLVERGITDSVPAIRRPYRLSEAASETLAGRRALLLTIRWDKATVAMLETYCSHVAPLVPESDAADIAAVAKAVGAADSEAVLVIDAIVPAQLASDLLPGVLGPFGLPDLKCVIVGADRRVLTLAEVGACGRPLPEGPVDCVWRQAQDSLSRYVSERE